MMSKHRITGWLTVALCLAAAALPAWAGGNLAGSQGDGKVIAYFDLGGAMGETPVEVPPLLSSGVPNSLLGVIQDLKQARQDPDVVAVVLNLEGAGMGLGQLEELHAALRTFEAVDKQIFIHADTMTLGTYTLATATSHISMVPHGDLWITGLHGERPYLRGLLDKIGVVPDFEHCGDYKSAGEMFMRRGPSEEAEQNMNWLVDGIFDRIVNLIATSRELEPDQVRHLIDKGLFNAEEALDAGLIDSVQHRQDFLTDLHRRYGDDVELAFGYGADDGPENPMELWTQMMQMFMSGGHQQPTKDEPSVAIVYVEGTIMTGSAEPSPFGSTEGAFSSTIRKALDTAAADDSVKAVVLRVDSPGGSALASEIILDAARRVADEKPLIVSMGNVAASGGYYVSCAADTIFADHGTYTASIGVIGGKLVTTGMWDKVGIDWHTTQRGQRAALMSSSHPWTDDERATIRKYMDETYDVFKSHVTRARGDKLTKPLDEMAGGRVFTGAQALELGLVDKLGGLEDAVKFAAKEARLGEYDIRVIPKPADFFDMLMSGGMGEPDYAHASLLDSPVVQALLPALQRTDPLRARAIRGALQKLDLFNRENVLMVLPDEMFVRP